MKKIHLEPWGPFDKLCLISTMHKLKQTFGDQNWAAISRHTRQLYETIGGLIEYEKRSDDWFSIKQCAAQYEALMKGTGTRKKKRGERNTDNSDSLDLLETNLKQEFVEELQGSLPNMRKEYMRSKQIIDDIDNDKVDDEKLEELILECEEKGVVDIKSKLKSMLDEKNNENESASKPSQPVTLVVSSDHQAQTSETKPCSTTSPLLTSLLQSPSPLRSSLPSTSSPTISLLLHSSPPVPTTISDSTLSKLLETPTSIPSSSSNVSTTLAIPSSSGCQQSTSVLKNVNEEKMIVIEKLDSEKIEEARIIVEDMTDVEHDVVESEIIIEQQESPPTKKTVSRRLELEVEEDETEEDVLETVEEIIERVEEAIIETVGENNLGDLDLTQSDDPITIDSDTTDIEEQLEIDQEQTVEVIVLDTTQGMVEDGSNLMNNETVIISGSPMKISEDTVIINDAPVKINSDTVIIDDSSMKLDNNVLPVKISHETEVIDDSTMKINNDGVVPMKITDGRVVIDDPSMKICTETVILDNTPANSLVKITDETIVIDDTPLKICPNTIILEDSSEKRNSGSVISKSTIKINEDTVIISDATSESESETFILNQSPIKVANDTEINEVISTNNEVDTSPQKSSEQCEAAVLSASPQTCVESGHKITTNDEELFTDSTDNITIHTSIELQDSLCQTETVNATLKGDVNVTPIKADVHLETQGLDVTNQMAVTPCSDTIPIQSKSDLVLPDKYQPITHEDEDCESITPAKSTNINLSTNQDSNYQNIPKDDTVLKLYDEDKTQKSCKESDDTDIQFGSDNDQSENIDNISVINLHKEQRDIPSSPCQSLKEADSGTSVSEIHFNEEQLKNNQINHRNPTELSNNISSNTINENKTECVDIKDSEFHSASQNQSSTDSQEVVDKSENLVEVQSNFNEIKDNAEENKYSEIDDDITEDKNYSAEDESNVEISNDVSNDQDIAESQENVRVKKDNSSKEEAENMESTEKVGINKEDKLLIANVPEKIEEVSLVPEHLESTKNKEKEIEEPMVEFRQEVKSPQKSFAEDMSDSEDDSSSSKYNDSTITSDLDDKEQLSEITDAEESEDSSRDISPPSSPPRRSSLSALKDKEITFHSVVSQCYQEVKDRAADLVTSPKKKEKPAEQNFEKSKEKKTELKSKRKPAKPTKRVMKGQTQPQGKDFDDSSSDSSLIRRIVEDERPDFCWKTPDEDFNDAYMKRQMDRALRPWRKSIMLVYNRLASHKFASVFSKPITEHEAPGYHDIVLRPMDLSTIKKNIDNGNIRSTVEFQRDMILMVQNAIIYNKYNTPYYEMAKEMGKDMLAEMEIMVQALGDGVPLLDDVGEEKQKPRARSSKPANEESSKKRKNRNSDDGRSAKRKRTSSS